MALQSYLTLSAEAPTRASSVESVYSHECHSISRVPPVPPSYHPLEDWVGITFLLTVGGAILLRLWKRITTHDSRG